MEYYIVLHSLHIIPDQNVIQNYTSKKVSVDSNACVLIEVLIEVLKAQKHKAT